MIQSDIIQSLCNLVEDRNLIDRNAYESKMDDVIKWSKILNKHMGDDKKFKEIMRQYDMAEGLYESAVCNEYYRQGFLCGAKLALEICGFHREDKN